MKRLDVMFLFCVVLFAKQLFAQSKLSTDYPFLYEVTLRTSVSYDANNGFYDYNYTLTNHPKNRGDIFMFEIDILRHAGSVRYDTVGLKFYSSYDELLFRRHYPPAANDIESVAFHHCQVLTGMFQLQTDRSRTLESIPLVQNLGQV